MTIKRFIVFSLIFHLIVVLSFFLKLPERKRTELQPFFANLVSPDEIKPGGGMLKSTPPKTKVLPVPPGISKPKQPRKVSKGTSEGKGINKKEKKSSSPANLAPSPSGIFPSAPLSKYNLFDPETIAKHAQKKTEQKKEQGTSLLNPKDLIPSGSGGKLSRSLTEGPGRILSEQSIGLATDSKDLIYLRYLETVKMRIQSVWIYPYEALSRGIYGDLYINFTIKKDGTLGSIELIRTSGYTLLDDAAMRAIKDAGRFLPLPEGWKEDALTIKGHFLYLLSIY
ncbi:MAG: TonB family protein [Nitrospiraceae bacterium]|nr:TonB family protein [Nitrospiraceae bacterium]